MAAPSPPHERRWFERTVIAAMVLAGFAIGSVGLTVAAELLGEDPVLTDEFNAPVAEDETSGIVAVAATTTTTTTTQPPTTESPTTTVDPEPDREGREEQRRDRGGRDDDREARRRT